MSACHLVFLVEEPSMEAFLRCLLPRLLPEDRTFEIHPFQGKSDLLGKLLQRLRGYARWLPDDWRVVVVIDRDDDDCVELKTTLEDIAHNAGLSSRTAVGDAQWQIVNRIAIEELEAWYFGAWEAVREAYPRVPANIPAKAPYRDPDAILGGTWEALERLLKKHGYFRGGLRKVEVAREIGSRLDPATSSSASFRAFHTAVVEAIS